MEKASSKTSDRNHGETENEEKCNSNTVRENQEAVIDNKAADSIFRVKDREVDVYKRLEAVELQLKNGCMCMERRFSSNDFRK